MKKIIAMLVMCAAVTSQAEYLFWQVSDTKMNEVKSNLGLSEGTYYATVHYGSGQHTSWTEGGVLSVGTQSKFKVGGDGTLDDSIAVNMSQITAGASKYSYYIELFAYDQGNYNGVAVGEVTTYSSLVENSFVGEILSPQSLAPWTGGTYVTPEPTSALLLVLGAALLGLKRKVA